MVFLELTVCALILWMMWLAHRVYRSILPSIEIPQAYLLNKYKREIEAKKVDFEEMLQDYRDFVSIRGRRISTDKGTLDQIDESVEGETQEETKEEKTLSKSKG